MALHIKQIKRLTSTPKDQLFQLYEEHVKQKTNTSNDNSHASPYQILTIRVDNVTINGKQYPYHRIFIRCEDSKEYFKTGWILEHDIPLCMICQTSFTSFISFASRHHCRACGNVVCSSCCNNQAVVRSIETLGPVKICRFCYFEQEVLDSYNSLQDGIPVSGLTVPSSTPISNQIEIVDPKLEAIKKMERILLEKEVSDLTIRFEDFDDPDNQSSLRSVEENRLLSEIRLRDYGTLSIQAITPHFVMKLSSKLYSKTVTPNSRARNCLFVNLCSCEAVPLAPKPIDQREGSNRSLDSEQPNPNPPPSSLGLFCLVFGPIIEGTRGNFLIDCAVHPKLLEETALTPSLLRELALQVTIGVSFYRSSSSTPFYQSYEMLTNVPGNYLTREMDSPNTDKTTSTSSVSLLTSHSSSSSMTVLVIPSSDCCLALRYVYTKYSDLSQPDRTKGMNMSQLQTQLATLKHRGKDYLTTIQEQLTTLRNLLAPPPTQRPVKIAAEDSGFMEVNFDEIHPSEKKMNSSSQRASSAENTRPLRGGFLSRNTQQKPTSSTGGGGGAGEKKERRRRFSAMITSMLPAKTTSTNNPSNSTAATNEKGETEVSLADSDNNYHSPLVEETAEVMNDEKNPQQVKRGRILKGMKKMLRNSMLALPTAGHGHSSGGVGSDGKTSVEPSGWYWEERGTTGHKFLTEDLFVEDLSQQKIIDYNHLRNAKDSIALKNEIIRQPNYLLGWKVAVQRADFSIIGVYIVTGLAQLFRHGLVYRLSYLDQKDVWVKLNLVEGDNHLGYPFVLIEKAIEINKK